MLARENLEGRVFVDSAGTGGWHAGEAPDRRSQAAAAKRGYDLSTQRARQVSLNDFHHFDLILAMDSDNLRNLHAIAPASLREKVHLLLDFAEPAASTREVPDPYYGDDGFDLVLDLVESGCEGLLARVREMLEAGNTSR